MIQLNQVCYRTRDLPDPHSLKTYENIGGYSALKHIIRTGMSPDAVIQIIKDSGLRGRGGAGFPTGLKWSFINRDRGGPRYLICNADESEPGTSKDRDILLFNPHQVLEGMAIACYVMNATAGYLFLRGEFWDPFCVCEHALEEACAAGYVGNNVFQSGIDIHLFNHRSGGAYICGEETALMNALEGKKAMPRFKPPFPANFGLYGYPTNINNVETLASVPVILEKGADWFCALGTQKSAGTKIFSVSGHVARPGNYEISMGTSFAQLLSCAGGMQDGMRLKAVIPGGSSMPVLPADIVSNLSLDYESIAEAGSLLGSGGMIVMNEHTCMVRMLMRILRFYYHESCGQCTPCREGSGWIYRLTQKIEQGHGTQKDLERLATIARNIEGRTICVFGEAMSWPVGGMLKHFYDEFQYHIDHKQCVTA